MIKLNKSAIVIISLSLLIFLAYNVMTVDAQSATTDPNRMLLYNEIYSKYVQQQQQPPPPPQQQPYQQQPYQQQPYQQPYNSYNNFADFQLFMQFMMYYEQLYGKDYIIKLYEDDDDETVKHIHKHFDDYKKKKHGQGDKEGTKGGLWNSDNRYHPDYAGDDRKYCTGNGVWKDGKCNIEDDEERADYEDAVCDAGPSKACGNIITDIYTGKEIEKLGLLDDPRYWNDKPKLLVPDEFKGTLTKEQKEALDKENPNWEFSKSVELIPNSLEGTETQEQMDRLAKAGPEWEYEWEDTDSNPVPGTPSYVDPDEVKQEEQTPIPVIEDGSNIVEPPIPDGEIGVSPTKYTPDDESQTEEDKDEEYSWEETQEETNEEEEEEPEKEEPEEEEEEEEDDESEEESDDGGEEESSEE